MPRIRRRTYKVRSSFKGGTTTRQISPWMTQFSLVDSRLIKECLSSEECYMKCMKNIAVPYKFICEAIQEEFITDIDHIPRIRGEIVGDILRGEACCGSIDENISLPELRPAFQNARTFTNNALWEIGRCANLESKGDSSFPSTGCSGEPYTAAWLLQTIAATGFNNCNKMLEREKIVGQSIG
ncbi:hypothetical protein H6P81_006486 [Aristolochia fimbriata]|uniref:Uncharacterized protein n=1 Tax=Aristolochia fimbriata TaxID=158543 RepID=A0AAV7F0W9_ARIFI|nr:hypothetical protein H6P81_006486 [Aristolochia fimbriata]